MRTDELPPAQAPTVSTPAAEALNSVDKTKLVVPTEEGEKLQGTFREAFLSLSVESVERFARHDEFSEEIRRWLDSALHA